KDKIPPIIDIVSKLVPATTIPDMPPPVAPPSAMKTSTVPCVFARVEGSVESTMRDVPLMRPKFQPNPSKIRAIFMNNKESPGTNAATIHERSNVAPEATAIVFLPYLSTKIPVKGEGRYIAAI